MAEQVEHQDTEEKALEFEWGKKRGIGGKKKNVQFYESFTFDGEEYKLFDCVFLYVGEVTMPFIGKLIKIWENADKSKKVKVHWFFRPGELGPFAEGIEKRPNELFFACGEGLGAANVNPLESIAGKCNVVCISKDARNPQPSEEEIQKADFVFYRFFDVGRAKILDEIDDKIAGIAVSMAPRLTGDAMKNAHASTQDVVQAIPIPRAPLSEVALARDKPVQGRTSILGDVSLAPGHKKHTLKRRRTAIGGPRLQVDPVLLDVDSSEPLPPLTLSQEVYRSSIRATEELRRISAFTVGIQSAYSEVEGSRRRASELEMMVSALQGEKERLSADLAASAKASEDLVVIGKLNEDLAAMHLQLADERALYEANRTHLQGLVDNKVAELKGLHHEAVDQFVSGYHLGLEHVLDAYPNAGLELDDFGPCRDIVDRRPVGDPLFLFSQRAEWNASGAETGGASLENPSTPRMGANGANGEGAGPSA